MNTPHVFFYVQHLLGVGHAYRATRIAQGLARAGCQVHLLWGGTDVPGFDFTGLTVHRLTPVRSDTSFSQLVHPDGSPISEADKIARRDELIALFHRINPDIVITEAFPFGRRQMQFELVPLLQEARSMAQSPLIVSSIRDIMQEGRKPSRVAESNDFVDAYFDLVLVHADQRMIKIEETLQGVDRFSQKIRYTGLVTPDPAGIDVAPEHQCEILVSVGGGAFGHELAEAAVDASKLKKFSGQDWLVATGSEMSEVDFQALATRAKSSARLIRFIPDLMSAMRVAKVSVSHAGYNTVADILRAQTKAVLYPYVGDRETEQRRRSTLMQANGLAIMIEPAELSAENLLDAIERAMNLPPAETVFDLEGADRSAGILLEECRSRMR